MKESYQFHKSPFSLKNKFFRMIWTLIWFLFVKPLPRTIGNSWKVFLLNLFGSKIHKTAIIYSNVKIYDPRRLEMKEFAMMGPDVDCYNVANVTIGKYSIVSQKTYLCSASHDITLLHRPLIAKPIIIEDQVWIGASTFIGMGVVVGQGAVVGATASVYKNVEPWTVVGGNPAKFIKNRVLESD